MSPRPVSVVMLAYGAEPYLSAAVAAVLASSDVDIDLTIVDNGAEGTALAQLPSDPRVRVVAPGENLGFAGGVDFGAAYATAPTLALVNSDAIVAPDALAILAARCDDPQIGVAGALVLLADSPDTINSAGNPLHVLGLSWAGEMGRPARDITDERDVASASGACLAMRREVWDAMGGFPAEFFAYCEDLELSWRCRQRGLRAVTVPQATAVHHYEFSRSPLKMYLVERNRLLFLLTCHQTHTLWLLAPALLAFEIAITLVALVQGWGKQKLGGWGWIWRHRRWVRDRRREVQGARTVHDRALKRLMTSRFDPAQTPLPSYAAPLEWLLQAYWRVVRPLV